MAFKPAALPTWQRAGGAAGPGGLCLHPAASVLNDGDTYWHVATGHWILAHRPVPPTDPFSFTALGHPWVTHEWLSQVLMALAYAAAGWTGVSLIIAMAAAATRRCWPPS